MKSLGIEIKTAAKPKYEVPDKAIFWAAEKGYGNLNNGDSNRFPGMAAIVARKSADQPNPLATFGAAVSQAQERVWVIDLYFLEPEKGEGSRQNRISQILNWMPDTMSANDIRILTKSHNIGTNKKVDSDLTLQFQEHANIINSCRSKGAGQCVIELRFTLKENFDYVHDRFAIIDDELWHFGATVGGFHSQVSAATRGWRASEHGAEEFFNLAWNTRSQTGKQR
jgi:phosphatidylserine/phosphatidylglycerophosphate/cardiolipin synthase-like enzyme